MIIRRSFRSSVHVEHIVVNVHALARVLVLQVRPHRLLGFEADCTHRRKFLAVGEDAIVLNVLLEVLDQLLNCLDDAFTLGIFSEFSKSDSSPFLVIGLTVAGTSSPQFIDVLLDGVDLYTEKIDRSAGFCGLALGVRRQVFDLHDLIGSAINFAHHTDHHFLYVLTPAWRG